jgi:DNA-binding NarL/FixJ family response regulator
MRKPLPTDVRVLLIEDDPLDAELVTRTLRHAAPRATVVRVHDAAGLRREIEAGGPDVVLSDHGVSGLNALEALRFVQAHRPECPFVLVSGGYGAEAVTCLKTGAADFVHKSELPRLPDAIVAALELRKPLRQLSERQREVFQLLASGLSSREIAARLGLSVKTIETHRANVMKRLGVRNLAELVRAAVRLGVVAAADA